jgi:KUP system potassium uptake protein
MTAPSHPAKRDFAKLSLGALGVVYGDIGTSPLYAIKECFHSTHAVSVHHDNVLGVLSLVVWTLFLVVVIKYLTFIMRADNRGEGGILALSALLFGRGSDEKKLWVMFPVLLGLFGAGLLYGESIITPAISILGAMEGLGVATHKLEPLILPITVGILIVLFLVQRFGTRRIGSVFGWIMLVWFIAIGVAGTVAIAQHPAVLEALNPYHAIRFFIGNGLTGFLLLGSVVLVVTGAEALYADMGHFGRLPIRAAWYAIALPGLLLNYFGQGAVMLSSADPPENPFYALAPGPWLYPMVVIATLAAIIASQALISGVFSLTRAAVQLGFFPRVRVIHTSGETEGQVYIPEINWMMMVGCVALAVGFGSSSALAAAYGIAVTATMAITSCLFFGVAVTRWGWSRLVAGTLVASFLIVDLSLLSANLVKIGEGGWFPLSLGALVFIVMTTWRRGRRELAARFAEATLPTEMFLEDLKVNPLHRVRGTAVVMSSTAGGIPPVLLHHVKHNQVLHQQVVLLSIQSADVPEVPRDEELDVVALGQGFFQVMARVGFMQTPNVPRLLARCKAHGIEAERDRTSYFLGRETLLVSGRSKMARWRKAMFAFLSRNARPATAFFHLPPGRVVELGAQIEL